LAVVPKDGAAASQAARSVPRDPRLPSWKQPSRLTGPPGPHIAHCAAALRRGCCRAAASSALSRGSSLRRRPSQERVCCLEPAWRSWRAPARRLQLFALSPAWCVCTHFFLNCQNRLSEQANLDSKLKVEVCVRTGTKFVSEQGLRLNVRVSPWLALGRTCCMLSPSVARRETSRQEEGGAGQLGMSEP